RTAAVTAGLGLAPLIAVMLPATAAHAHGYVSAPPSRQAQCAQGIVDCGAIRWEPQSVEGPKGLRSCSGGNARFSELDDDGKGWQAATVGNTVTFTWTFTARHRTRDYEYYVGKAPTTRTTATEVSLTAARPGTTPTTAAGPYSSAGTSTTRRRATPSGSTC